MNKEDLLMVAGQLTPELYEKTIAPQSVVEIIRDPAGFQGWKAEIKESAANFKDKILGRGESVVLDFGNHEVGYLTFGMTSVGSPQDAPCRVKFTFAEVLAELGESFKNYKGWLSKAWFQEEVVTFDVMPCEVSLPRRYSFRYVKIEVIDTSRKYKVRFTDFYCTAVSSANTDNIQAVSDLSPEMQRMDAVGRKTLQNCMQTVFEDGPKRDRRLWIGDLRLQALANYETFQNFDLVKRCLYLFAGLVLENGQVAACVYEKPFPLSDDTVLFDYSLFYVATLHDYFAVTKDHDTLVQLWPTAYRQLEIALEKRDERGIVQDNDSWWCFIDWHETLNKQASAQAILLYSLRRALILARELRLTEEVNVIETNILEVRDAILTYLWDQDMGFFVSGADRQVSWASQIWMALAEIFDEQESGKLLDRLFAQQPAIKPNTPYMYHHLVEALFLTGRQTLAWEQLHAYWGTMIKYGADCFWEVFDPNNLFLSPYGDSLINSYCHAWSCTPTYFIRKYSNVGEITAKSHSVGVTG